MPTLNVSTNVPVDAVVASDILKDCTRIVAKIIGKPESVRTPVSVFVPPVQHFLLLHFFFAFAMHNSVYTYCFLQAQYVMILINGGVPIAFAGSEEPAAYGEVISIGGLGPSVNAKLSFALAEILETKLSVDSSRFYIKFYDVQRSFFGFNGSTF
ncbi:unnamed protein product [Musa acuminata subsp. burmannicoides]